MRKFMLILMTAGLALAPNAFGQGLTLKADRGEPDARYSVEREKRGNRPYRPRYDDLRFAFGARLAYTGNAGDWSDAPYLEAQSVTMFGDGWGFDLEAGQWIDQFGWFAVFGGNSFDTGEYEAFVSERPGQFLDAEAAMYYFRADLKARMRTTTPLKPVFKIGVGYYFFDGEERFRYGDRIEYSDYDGLFNNNLGINVGGEVHIKNRNGLVLVGSLDVIHVFNGLRYASDDEGVTQIKLGVGLGFETR